MASRIVFAQRDDDDGDAADDDLDEDIDLLRPALPVGPTRKLTEAELASPPATGEDYLRRVRLEANRVPPVVVAKTPPTATATTTTTTTTARAPAYVAAAETMLPAPPGLEPTREWTAQFMEHFTALRQQLDAYISQQQQQQQQQQGQRAPQLQLPKAKDERGWRVFCFGDGATTAPTAPLLPVVAAMDQVRTVAVLRHFVVWLEQDDALSPLAAQWLYALLTRLDQLLTGDVTDVLRKLCRRCSIIRSRLTPKDDPTLVASLNMVVVIVGDFFVQRDLLM